MVELELKVARPISLPLDSDLECGTYTQPGIHPKAIENNQK